MNFKNIATLFETAVNAKLKYPKITIEDPNTGTVVFKRAGSMSKYEGQIMITNGGAFGSPSNKFYGRIDLQGVLNEAPAMNPFVRGLTQAFEADPIGVAKKYASLTGHCMFCTKPLNDPRSTANGYGPVCAEKFNLPWDAAKESKVTRLASRIRQHADDQIEEFNHTGVKVQDQAEIFNPGFTDDEHVQFDSNICLTRE